MKIQTATYITAKHDINGNPRRAYIINEIDTESKYSSYHIIDVIDEGYNGKNAVSVTYPNCLFSGYQIQVSPSEYNQYIKIGVAKRKENK
jgi:hypothetical protein